MPSFERQAPESPNPELIVGPRFTGVDHGEYTGAANGFALSRENRKNPNTMQTVAIRDFVVISFEVLVATS